MRDVVEQLDRWRAAGNARTAIATVVGVKRSAPRPPGAKMALAQDGSVAGAVSGGCVEGAVVVAAEEVLEGGEPRMLHFGISDDEAWDVGLPCGGEIDVWIDRPDGPEGEAFAALARADGRGALVTRLDGGGRMLVDAEGIRTGSLGTAALDDGAAEHARELMWAERSERRTVEDVEVFVDATAPSPRVIIFGAVDHSAALCTLARAARWRPFVVDPRERFATPERFPDAERVVAKWPAEAFADLGGIDRATSIVVLTHDPKLDDAALQIALASDAGYIGAMGSRLAQAGRRERLLARGLTDDDLARISAPIGLDLGGLTSEETALSIMAELVAVRRGHPGGRLRDAEGRIHEVGA
ncbi:XdhC family protein [Paraconexibacter sp.]|uniref:XdhC family protein n=1 Tax=Paraconexibacter sp. TaxID=2949640 RepID=UPI00356777AE